MAHREWQRMIWERGAIGEGDLRHLDIGDSSERKKITHLCHRLSDDDPECAKLYLAMLLVEEQLLVVEQDLNSNKRLVNSDDCKTAALVRSLADRMLEAVTDDFNPSLQREDGIKIVIQVCRKILALYNLVGESQKAVNLGRRFLAWFEDDHAVSRQVVLSII